MAEHTYIACNLTTGRVLAELPCSGVSYENAVNRAGDFRAAVPLQGQDAAAVERFVEATVPGKTTLFIDRDGTLVWGGILWGRRYDRATSVLQVDGKETVSYLDRVYITEDMALADDQFAIARSLATYALQKGFGTDRLMIMSLSSGAGAGDDGGYSGVYRERTYIGTDTKAVGEALRDLANVEQGLDFCTRVSYEGTAEFRRIQTVLGLGYPLGRPYTRSGIVFEVEADTLGFTLEEDAWAATNAVYVWLGVPEGSPDGTLPQRYEGVWYQHEVEGWPRLERAEVRTDVTVYATAEQYGRELIAAEKYPAATAEVTVRGEVQSPVFGSYIAGDECLLRVRGDVRWPNGLEVLARITSVTVQVGDDGRETVKAALSVPGLYS